MFLRKVWGQDRRICSLMLGVKGLNTLSRVSCGYSQVFALIYFSMYSDEQVHHPPDPQRYLSDSEVELKQSQESIARESEIRWAWGKLPQVGNHNKRNEGNLMF